MSESQVNKTQDSMLDNSTEDTMTSDVYENGEDDSNHEDEYADPGEEHEFEIIDQIESEEENNLDKVGGFSSRKDGLDDYSSSSDDLDDSELHALLEKGIDKDSIKKLDEYQEGRPIIKHKIVLNELESDPFDILPEGWVWVTHNSGMPVYLHRETRVCTMARPYSLGSASARTHDIPISAIPCLQYRRQKEKLKLAKEGDNKGNNDVTSTTEKNSAQENMAELNIVTPMEKDNICPALKASSSNEKIATKVWVVAEESAEFKMPDNHHGALHTGVSEYKGIPFSGEDSLLELTSSSVGENIAVSLDTSCIDNTENSSFDCQDSNFCHSEGLKITENLDNNVINQDSENSVSSINAPGKFKDINESDLERSACPYNSTFSVDKQNISSIQLAPDAKNADSKRSGENDTSISQLPVVVTEEVTCNTERSELVTSSTNQLANIKRKIESLKNKRGAKQRKLDSGSATGWPTDNNIAVKTVSSGRDDTFNAPQIPNADEKLKAHAAEVKIKSAEERAKESLLDSTTVHTYCAALFQFKTLEVKKYRSWRERRQHLGERSRRNRPELPPSTKLITCPIPGNLRPDGTGDNAKKREFILNPTGKSYLCILHEYMQRTLKIQPLYVFKELENSKTPYGATVMINNIEYGTGYASSKKVAKQEAAKETLKVLIPDLFKKITDQEIKRNISDLSFFDDIKVTDPRVNELGNKVGQPSPFQLLLECLRRNFGMGNTQCEVSTKQLKNQKCEFTINVGKHSATVVAKNKREGKQLAAQAILAKLHPHVPSWGSLLRLYGTSVEKAIQKPEEINNVKSHAPNHSVLESLREEMRKLHRQKEAIQSKGKMIISTKDLPSKMSGVDL